MFKRLVFEDYAVVCTVIAFLVVAAIFLATVWKAIRMPKAQLKHFANLPFEDDASRHDERS